MECVLPIRQECRVAGEVFPPAAWSGAVDSPESCLGGRQMAYSMPELRMVLAVPGTHFVGDLHQRYMIQDIVGILHSWRIHQCTAGTFLSGNLHLWSMVLCTAGMQCFGTLHMDLVALSECI